MTAVLVSAAHQEWQHWSKSQTNFDFTSLTSLQPLIRSQYEHNLTGEHHENTAGLKENNVDNVNIHYTSNWLLILNKSKVWNIHAELSKVFTFFFKFLFSPPSSLHVDLTFFSINYHAQEVFQGEEQPSAWIVLTRRHGPITPVLRRALMWRKRREIGANCTAILW